MYFSIPEIISLSVMFVEDTEKAEFNHINLTCKSVDFFDDIKEYLHAEKDFMGFYTGVMYLCAYRRFICPKPTTISERAQEFDNAKKWLEENYKLLNLESYGDYARWKKQQDS